MEDGKTVHFVATETDSSMNIYENEKKIAPIDKSELDEYRDERRRKDEFPNLLEKTSNGYQYVDFDWKTKRAFDEGNVFYGWVSSDGKNAIFLKKSKKECYVYKNEQMVAGPFNDPDTKITKKDGFTPLPDDNIFFFLQKGEDGNMYFYTVKEKIRINLTSNTFGRNPDGHYYDNKIDDKHLFNGKKRFFLLTTTR